jgi:hypothetical protein
MTTKGAFIAAAVAGLFSAATPFTASAKSDSSVQCQGVNACKGKGGCHSSENACKGQNGCKGKGWTSMSEKDCKAKGGTMAPSEKPADKK